MALAGFAYLDLHVEALSEFVATLRLDFKGCLLVFLRLVLA